MYHIFGGLWITQFVIACQHVTIAGAVSTWYFTREKSYLRDHSHLMSAVYTRSRQSADKLCWGKGVQILTF